jgi:archaetidylinositol phosphate synthase
MLYKRRDYFERTGKRIGSAFSKIPLSPNQWTALGLSLVLIMLYFLINQNFLLAAAIFAIASLIDMIDGSVARESKKVTKIGGYLDSITDRVIEFIIILGLFLNNYPDFILPMRLWLVFLFFGSFMSTYTRAAAFEKEVFKNLKGGILEHTDRLIIFFLIIAVSAFSLTYASYLIVLTAVLANLSALQRFSRVVKR